MSTNTLIATESQLGRSKNDARITRPALMKELVQRGVRMTAQRRLAGRHHSGFTQASRCSGVVEGRETEGSRH